MYFVGNKNRIFPRWSGPFVGAIVGTIVGVQAAIRNRGGELGVSSVYFIIGGAIIGMFAGCLIALLDSPPKETDQGDTFEQYLPAHLVQKKRVSQSGLVGKVLALIAFPMSLFPIVGLMFIIPAVVVNRNSIGWTKTISWIAFVISICLSTIVGIGLVIENLA